MRKRFKSERGLVLRNFAPQSNIYKAECPSCEVTGNWASHGSYTRHLVTQNNEELISIQRMKCLSCGHTHALLPPEVVPYRHFSLTFLIDVCKARVSDGAPVKDVCKRFSIGTTTLYRIIHAASKMVGVLVGANLSSPKASSIFVKAASNHLSLVSDCLALLNRMPFESVRLLQEQSAMSQCKRPFP